ncbi:uncharacterized protein LOC129905571 [Episyrphus balteatus]|uniref:uncharacterized protein LOC129905571 n=1 Tax=Episyrphus balteatus TaxID=286459 RepID=UPI0024857D2E|nr:uncharacterized protein LOC129905571 [Episyrphus balteatus]
MDILRKMFNKTENEANTDDPKNSSLEEKDGFRKPSWFDESDTDDELFGDNRKFVFQVFTNPMELQKHFEHQMQQIMEAVSQYEENPPKFDKDLKEDYLKPGFEEHFLEEFEKQKKMFDTDLDGEIKSNQLHSLLQRAVVPEMSNILPRNDNRARMLQPKKKLSDEETILGRIHGTLLDDETRPPAKGGPDMIAPPIKTPFGGVFEGAYQGPKMFRQSVMVQTVRKPDGSYETTKVTQDSEGNTQTQTTRTINGKSETVTSFSKNNKNNEIVSARKAIGNASSYSDRNIYVSKQGYALPMNLW